MLAGLDSNPIVQLLGNELDTPHLKETILFFFCVSIVGGIRGGKKDFVSAVGLSFLRAFGDINIALALGLGSMPGAVFKNLDTHMWNLVGAIMFVWFSGKIIPAEIGKHLHHVTDLSYAIVKGNNCGAGYAAAAAACPGQWWAPLIGAYVAVNGARLIENGMGAINKKPDNDDILAIGGGFIIFVLSTHLQASALTARAILALFAYSCNHVDWQAKFNEIVGAAAKA